MGDMRVGRYSCIRVNSQMAMSEPVFGNAHRTCNQGCTVMLRPTQLPQMLSVPNLLPSGFADTADADRHVILGNWRIDA